jgi:putative ABC transport system permease protein
MPTAMTELRHALRRLVRTPVFALAAALTLSLAIGANTTVFALLNGVVLNPLPFPDSNRLIALEHGSGVIRIASGIGLTSGMYYQFTKAGTLEALAIYRAGDSTLVTGGRPERISIARTTADLSRALQVSPRVGRWFTEAEAAPGGPAVAVLSHGFWVRRFGADPAVMERSVSIDGVPTQIVGIMPASFAFPDPLTDVWLPARVSRAMGFAVPFGYRGVARLKPGVSIERARAELNTLIADLPNAYAGDRTVLALGSTRGGLYSTALPLKDATIGSVGNGLWVLLTAMALLLFVACANVGNLVLVRAEARQREIIVRRALGANLTDVAKYFLSESLWLTGIGAAGGLAIASVALSALVVNGPATLPRLHEVRIDAPTVVFTVALSLVASAAFGLIPLLRALSFSGGLRDAGRATTASVRQHRTRHVLMAGQVAVALALLVGAALLARSYDRLRAIDLGFTPSSALTFRVGLPERDYPTRAAAVHAHRAILEQLQREPGVVGVSASTGLPLADACFGNAIIVRGQAAPRGMTGSVARLCAASEGYVTAMQMRLLRGRDLVRADIDDGRTNVLVNEAFVTRVLGGGDPIGRQVRSSAPPPPDARAVDGTVEWDGAPPWLTIVGVVSNTPFETLIEPTPEAVLYMPLSIAGGPDIPSRSLLGPSISAATYVVRSSVAPAGLTAAVQRAVQTVDNSLAVAQVLTLQGLVDRGAAQMALTMTLLVIAAAVALAIGVIGIYGVIAYVVSQRRNEIGVRLALGATPRTVVAMIVKQGAIVALSGVAAGLALAAACSGVLASLLFGVTPHDPMVFAGVGALLTMLALVACWIPARRAARINPTDALRVE